MVGLSESASGQDRLREQRIEKLRDIRERFNRDPYPARVSRTHTSNQVVSEFVEGSEQIVTVAGRIVGGIRAMGKSTFVHLQDAAGRVQLYFKSDALGPDRYEGLLKLLDVGDFINATGVPFR